MTERLVFFIQCFWSPRTLSLHPTRFVHHARIEIHPSLPLREGIALGTFASYITEKKTGDVVLRMRADAMHTANVEKDARCSLYVQPSTQPPGVLSRATLIGSLEALDEAAADAAAAQYNAVHGENVGVDAAGQSDNYYKFVIDRVFYVGGLGSDKRAEVGSDAGAGQPRAHSQNHSNRNTFFIVGARASRGVTSSLLATFHLVERRVEWSRVMNRESERLGKN